MKSLKFYLFFLLIITQSGLAIAQQCLTTGYCNNLANPYPGCIANNTTTTTWTSVAPLFYGGDYAIFDVVQGATYAWSTCSTFGGSQSADAQITLKNAITNSNICFSDNCGLSACPFAPYLQWTATYTGQVKVLLSVFTTSSCQTTFSGGSNLVWRRTNNCSVNVPSNFSTSSTSSSITLNWSPVSGATGYAIYDCYNMCDSFITTVSSNSVTISGLSPNSSYSIRVMTLNGSCNSVKSACQNITTQGSCSTPNTQSQGISFSNIGSDQLTLGWTSGNGTNRIVVAKSGASITGTPSDGSVYTSNSTLGNGSTISSNEYVIYNGTGSSTTVYGLSPSTTYYFRVFDYNCSGSSIKYNTSNASNNPRSQTTACNSSISPSNNLSISKNGGNYNIGVTTSGTCPWTATSNNSWITITSGSSGNSNGTCSYTVGVNNTGSTRYGSITIANRSFDIRQSAPPIADFSISKNAYDAGETINISDNSTNSPNSWSWTVSGGTPYESGTFNGQNIQFNLSNPGSFRVKLTVSNNSGSNTKEIAGYISVKSKTGVPVNPSGSFVIRKGYPQKLLADPIQLGTGTYTYSHTDFSIPVIGNNLNFTRYYNSLNNSISGSMGFGWTHTYKYSVQNLGDTIWDLFYPDGHSARFIPIYNGGGVSFPLYGGTFDSLVKTGSGDFWMYTKEKNIYKFDNNGRFYQMENPNGNQILLTYSGINLTAIIGSGGRTLILGYNTNNQITSIQSPFGRICKYTYDGNSNLTSVISPKGDTTQFTYDTNHLMITVVNGLGNTIVSNSYNQNKVIAQTDGNNKVTLINYNSPTYGITKVTLPDNTILNYHHDSFYRLVKAVDAFGKISTTAYDDNNNPDSLLNEKNQLTTYQYDNFGNLLVQNLPGNRTITSSYNHYQKITSLTDPKNQITLFTYNTSGNLIQIHYPNITNNYFDYNSNGTLKYSVKANGDTTFYFYNSAGDVIQVKTPTGIKLLTYDADGRLISTKDENSNTTTFVYDNNNNITSIIDALGKSILMTYDSDNQIISIKDRMGFITTYYYDKKGNKIASRNPMQGIDSFYYDVRDNLIRSRDANGNNTSYSYDANGRRTQITNSTGTIKYEYDELGNITKITDPANHSITLDYNIYNYISSTTKALNKTNSMTYDKVGNITDFFNNRNKQKSYSYNSLRQLTQVIDVDNETTQYQYNTNGSMNQVKDANNHIQNFVYGMSDRLTSYTDGAGNPYNMVYDSAGNIRTINKPSGSISQNYDALNRLVKSTLSSGDVYTYNYDANNNIISASNNLGATQFVFDSLNRMVRYTDPFNKQVSYKYNAVGSITSIIYPGNDSVKYTYDNANRLITVKDWKNNIFTYTYDSAGNVKRLQYPNNIRCDYTYDAINRITSKMTYLPSNAILYGQQFIYFDDSVRETRYGSFPSTLEKKRFRYQYRDDDAILSDSVIIYTNDSNGNRIREIQGNDTTRYTYTTDQLLSSYSKGNINISYGYNAFGQRITRTENGTQTRYVLNINNPLSLVLQTTDINGNVKAKYVYGLGLLEQMDSANNELFYHFDSRHNTIAVTDKYDTVRATYTYTLYGTVTNQTGSIKQPFTFLGEFGVEKENNSWYYIRARYYDANTGRFLSKDPLFGDEFEPQSLNRFIYSLNNPLETHDPTGLKGNKDYDGNSYLYKRGDGNYVYSLDQFLQANFGKSFWEIIHQRTAKDNMPGGPKLRIVINPIDGKEMDMRHVMIVGFLGNKTGGLGTGSVAGLGIEIGQWLGPILGRNDWRKSAFKSEDFYSNGIGDLFGSYSKYWGQFVTKDWTLAFYLFLTE